MPLDDMNFDGFDGKLYFHDGSCWEEVGNLDKMHELSTEIISCDAEDAKFEGCFEGMPVFEWDCSIPLRHEFYLWQLKTGIFAYEVPNNWRRMHGYRARRCTVARRKLEKMMKEGVFVGE